MDPFVAAVLTIGVLVLVVFWAWMFWDMTNNEDMPSNYKFNWTLAFAVFNIFAAVYYYVYVYRNEHDYHQCAVASQT